jgi:hypothetical protein
MHMDKGTIILFIHDLDLFDFDHRFGGEYSN